MSSMKAVCLHQVLLLPLNPTSDGKREGRRRQQMKAERQAAKQKRSLKEEEDEKE